LDVSANDVATISIGTDEQFSANPTQNSKSVGYNAESVATTSNSKSDTHNSKSKQTGILCQQGVDCWNLRQCRLFQDRQWSNVARNGCSPLLGVFSD